MAQIPSARLANAQSRRCGLMEASWRWGVLLIVLTMAIHAAAVVTMAFTGLSLRARLETRSLNLWNLIAIQICVIGVIGLLLAVLHGIECGIWAAAYLWLGALDSPIDALLYSVDAMSTRGASGLTLQRPWQMMGALEAVNGMLLFGISTAYVFAVMQVCWTMRGKFQSTSLRRRRAKARRTPQAAIKPGSPAPTMGPGTAAGSRPRISPMGWSMV